MAGLAHNQLYSNGPQTPLRWQKRPFEEEDDVVLDDNILDHHQSFDMATTEHAQRRESFASSASVISPRQHAWSDFSYNADAASVLPLANAAGLFPDNSGNQFFHSNAPNYPNYASNPGTWHPTSGAMSSDTPNAAFNTFASDLDTIKPEEPYLNEVPSSHPPNGYGGLPIHAGADYQQYSASAASPQWSTSSSDAIERIPKSGDFQNPMFNHSSAHLRSEGVRKKNARFDIPEGRSVHTIDQLINSADPNNESLIKELKQQKRLLRNRQAALDSRCRKKHHTEKLEEEKKTYLSIIERLEEDLAGMKIQEQRWLHERQQWHQYSETLIKEKEELVRQHTLETVDLRRKNSYLAEEAQRLEGISMSTQPSSAGFSAGFPSEFEHLTMDSSPFDDFSFIDNSTTDTEPKPESSLMMIPKKEKSSTKDEDKTATSGLLLMLLLCGAWVASNNASRAPAAIPRMPEDVQVASAAVLENIYKDAGLEPISTRQFKTNNAAVPQVRASQNLAYPAVSCSPLASLHHDLTHPNDQQQRDQLFSLSAEQYNHITSDDFFDNHQEPSQPPRRRNLGDALAAMRMEKQGPAAEVYTRSLMWSEVPTNVVKDFARMVAEGSGDVVRHQNGEPLS